MEFKSAKVCNVLLSFGFCILSCIRIQSGSKRVLFDAVKDGENVSPKWVPPEDQQEPNESRR